MLNKILINVLVFAIFLGSVLFVLNGRSPDSVERAMIVFLFWLIQGITLIITFSKKENDE